MFRSGKPAFKSLDRVPWAQLDHAYGSAVDVPQQLRQLVSNKNNVREGVVFGFYGNIFHQGTVYPATVAAIPFLIESLCYTGVPDRHQILGLLAHLALGYPEELVVEGVNLESMLAAANPLDRPKRRREDEDEDHGCHEDYAETVRQCYAEVGAGVAVYIALLDADDERLRIAAAHLLAWFPAHGWSAAPRLLEIAQRNDQHPLTRSSFLLALSHLANADVRPLFLDYTRQLVAEAIATHESGQRFAGIAATACLCVLRECYRDSKTAVPAAARDLAEACLRDGASAPNIYAEDDQGFPWGRITQHLQKVIRMLLKKPTRKKGKNANP